MFRARGMGRTRPGSGDRRGGGVCGVAHISTPTVGLSVPQQGAGVYRGVERDVVGVEYGRATVVALARKGARVGAVSSSQPAGVEGGLTCYGVSIDCILPIHHGVCPDARLSREELISEVSGVSVMEYKKYSGVGERSFTRIEYRTVPASAPGPGQRFLSAFEYSFLILF